MWLDEVVYVEQFYRFMQGILVNQLKQVLYGLKQILRVWYLVICYFLKEKSFTTTYFDQNVFISIDKQLFIAIFVDDLLLFGANKAQIDLFK